MGKIERITMFKLPEDAVAPTLEAYTKLEGENSKDGKPYILYCSAKKLYNDPRSQGFTVAATTTFSSVEDMKYYDEECAAHAALKKVVGPKAQGMMMIYMDA